VPLFSKKSSKDEGQAAEASAESTAPKREPRKANRWFEQARTVADTGNHDYAIECYVSGLQFDPEALEQHEALHEVSLKRKVKGGKPPGWRDKPPVRGKSHIERMLEAEWYFAMDPTAAGQALKVMEEAVAATEAGEAELYEVAYWIGNLALEANRAAKRPSKQTYIKVRDLYAEMGIYDKAVEACGLAVQMDPQNAELARQFRDLQAENTISGGGYTGDKGGFRKGIKDAEKQKQLEQEDTIAKTDAVKDEIVTRLRSEYEDNPEDMTRLEKLVRALRDTEEKTSEDEAIKLLEEAWEKTGQYRYKMQIGDIRMKQFNRALRELTQQIEKDPNNAELKDKRRRIATAQVKFELSEYIERVKNYPTDMGLRYQLGRRQLALQQYDEAIGSFQEAQSDPKHRAASLRYLGEAFAAKEWHDEAIDTFRRGIDAHERSDDRTALELRYDLMNSLEQKARENDDREAAQEAAQIASQIAQTDINFKDIRSRVDALRKLSNELKSKQSS